MKTVTLYRPIGEKELALIAESGFKAFPPRLEWQPIFYPVLNEAYACEIASKWNTNDEFGNYLGFVTKFDVLEETFLKYKVENVGGKHHNELWVPAEDLEHFNQAIVNRIKIIKVFVGPQFKRFTDELLIDELRYESSIYETRVNCFLETKSRRIVSFSSFDNNDEFREEENDEEEEYKLDFEILRNQAGLIDSVDDAVTFIIEKCLTANKIKEIKDETPLNPIEKSIRYHFGLNMFLRNLFSRMKNERLKKSINSYETFSNNYGEFGEGVITNALWRRLHNCELQNSSNRNQVEKIKAQIDSLYDDFFKQKGLVRGKITFEQYDDIENELRTYYESNNISDLNERVKLLSYGFSEGEIQEYLSVSDDDDNSFWENHFRKAAILAKVQDYEKETYTRLRDDYIETVSVVDKLIELNNLNNEN